MVFDCSIRVLVQDVEYVLLELFKCCKNLHTVNCTLVFIVVTIEMLIMYMYHDTIDI